MKNLLYNFCKTGLLLTAFIIQSCTHDPQGLEIVEPVCFDSQVYPQVACETGSRCCQVPFTTSAVFSLPQNVKLDDCPVAQIDKWIIQGMTNN